jgi:hypothetical protein
MSWSACPAAAGRVTALLLVGLVLASCGGGAGDRAAAPMDLGGWWLAQMRATGADPWSERAVLQMRHEGSVLRFHGYEGVVSESSVLWVLPDAADPFRQEWDVSVVAPERMEGTLQQFQNSAPGAVSDLLLTRISEPNGLLTAHGMLLLSLFNFEVETAHASVSTLGSAYTLNLRDSRPDGQTLITVAFSSATPGFEPEAGTVYELGVTPGLTTVLEFIRDGSILQSSSGSVLFTLVRDERVEGGFAADFGMAGSLNGLFSAPVLIRD